MGAMSFPPSPSDGDPYEKWYYDAASGEWKLTPISSSTLWSEGDDNKIYYDLGEVGVGTSEPTRDLVIFNSAGPVVQVTDQGSGNVNSDGLQLKQLSANSEIMNKEAGDLVLGTNDTARLTIDSTGRVGIGTPAGSVGAQLDVVRDNGTVAKFSSTVSGAYIGISDSATSNWWHQGIGVIGNDLKFKTGNIDRLTINSTGNATFSGTVTAPTLAIGNWKIELDGNALVFKYNNTKVAKMATNGKIISANDLRAFGTP